MARNYYSMITKILNVKHETKMSNNSKYKDPRAAESTAMTYGMSDEWDFQDTSDLEPYTLEELYARIEESEEQISRGEYQTEEEVREEMRKEFPWLINKIYRNYLTKDLPQLVTKF